MLIGGCGTGLGPKPEPPASVPPGVLHAGEGGAGALSSAAIVCSSRSSALLCTIRLSRACAATSASTPSAAVSSRSSRSASSSSTEAAEAVEAIEVRGDRGA
eukprot:scaffold25055_cov68-Phaeocystis_antarctica.AAC.9